MKQKLLITLLMITSLSYAGEYESYCYSKHHKMEVYGCLDKIRTKIQSQLDKKLLGIQNIGIEDGYSARLTKKDIEKTNYAFENYIEKQCGLLSLLPSGSGLGHQMEDCAIKMTSNRIKELEYIFEGMN